MIKAVIFDLDGVLIDTMPAHLKAEQLTLERFGITVDVEELREYTGQSVGHKFQRMIERYGSHHTAEDVLAEHFTSGYEYINANMTQILGAVDLVHTINGYDLPLAVASGSPMQHIDNVVSRLKVGSLFPVRVSADTIQPGKPDPAIFLEAARQLGVPPEYCLVIEDSENGVLAAKRAGMKCVGYQNPSSPHEDLSQADIVIESYAAFDISRMLPE